jgi:hypothetical protein
MSAASDVMSRLEVVLLRYILAVLISGMRVDVVLTASQPVGPYWIRVQGLAQCSWVEVQQLAVLLYKGSSIVEPTNPPLKLPYLPQRKVTSLRTADIEIFNFYFPPYIIRLTKSRTMRWADYVACMKS